MITLDTPRSDCISLKKCGNNACDKTYTTLLKCSRCHVQTYCGVECQKADWSQHKKICHLKTAANASKDKKLTMSTVKSVSDSAMKEISMPIPGLRLIENFISDDLHHRFIEQMHKGSAELNYGHYDGYDFEDTKAFDNVFNQLTREVFSKLKSLNYFSNEKKPLKLACTLIGYKKDGFITEHVDSPLLSGETVVLISFNSPVVVNFYSQEKIEKQQHKIFIPPKSMYSTSGEARHKWSHAILGDEDTYNSEKFERGTRYVVLFTPPGPLYSGTELLDY